MKITDNRKYPSRFGDINPGDLFEFDNTVFMKLQERLNYNGYNAVSLEDGSLDEFGLDSVVNYNFKAHLTLEDA